MRTTIVNLDRKFVIVNYKMNPNLQVVIARYNEPIEWASGFNTVLYNKGSFLEGSIPLENIGREAHTFLHHIVTRYDELAEYTCFVQGNPFDHCPDIKLQLTEFTSTDVLFLGKLHECDRMGNPHGPGLPVGDIYDRFFTIPKEKFTFYAGAQCIVSRDRILKRPKAFYEALLKENPSIYPWVYERLWPDIFSDTPILSIQFEAP